MPVYAIRSEDLYVQNAEVYTVQLKCLFCIFVCKMISDS